MNHLLLVFSLVYITCYMVDAFATLKEESHDCVVKEEITSQLKDAAKNGNLETVMSELKAGTYNVIIECTPFKYIMYNTCNI